MRTPPAQQQATGRLPLFSVALTHEQMIRVFLIVVFPVATTIASTADEPAVRFITTGWNTPTVHQFVRDANVFAKLPFDGCAIQARADSSPPHPFSSAHTAGSWDDVSFASTEKALDALDPKATRYSYLLISANPGDADWLDDKAWSDIVEHWRLAARLAKRGHLRGLLFDPEPYTKPFEQFNYDAQPDAENHSFADYAKAARKRGREVMQAVASEYADAEFFSYFLISYLVNDHQHRGPSPIDENGRREDFDWCLAGHNYGLLPAFLSGLLEASPLGMKFIDGCEYGYWLTKPNEFAKLSHDVRAIGRLIVDADVRQRYDRQITVAFPVFVDIVHPALIGDWAIEPEIADRMSILRRQLTAAIGAGDGIVWFYGERGRWWPAAKETALWKGKDTYLHWRELLPGCVQTIRDVRESAQPANLVWMREESPQWTVSETRSIDAWEDWNRENTPGQVLIEDDTIKVSGATDSAGFAFVAVRPGDRFRISAKVRQVGRGLTQLVVRYRDASDQWITGRGIESFAYPRAGDPSKWRPLVAAATVPEGAEKMVLVLSVKKQWSPDDTVEFSDVQIRCLRAPLPELR